MKTNILFLIESLSGGGAEKVLTILLNNLNIEKYNVTLCTMVNTGVNKTELKSNIKYTSILKPPCNNANVIKQLLYKLKYKLVYSFFPLKWVYSLWIPKGNDIEIAFCEGYATKLLSYSTNKHSKKIAWVHTDLKSNPWPLAKKIFKNFNKQLTAYKRFNQIITVSKYARERFIELHGMENRVKTLINPINSTLIQTKSQEHVLLPKKKKTRLVTIGRLVEQKGYDRLVRIASRLKNNGLDFELWIIGDGPERTQLESDIKKLSLDDTIKLWGFKSNPYKYMSECDAFVCSSRSEGYSTAVTEAIILGLAVVTTDCSGMSELLLDGKAGIITENNEDALYSGIYSILSSTTKLKQLQNLSINRSHDISLQSLMKPIEQMFDSI